MNASANKLAKEFDFSSMAAMAERTNIPQRSRILGLGATMAALGEEMAFYRQDIFWTNVAPAYNNPDIEEFVDQEPTGNIEYRSWGLEDIDDILADNEFDRIYCSADDISHLGKERLRKIGHTLVRVLDDNGVIKVSNVPENRVFIEHATHNKFKNIMTYSATKKVTVEPHLVNGNSSSFAQENATEPREPSYVTPTHGPLSSDAWIFVDKFNHAKDIAGVIGYGAVLLGMLAAGSVVDRLRRKHA